MKKNLLLICLLCSLYTFAQDGNGMHYGPQKGLKGYLESGYTIGVGSNHDGHFTLLATIGYQINPYLFVGAGTGENYYPDSKLYAVPFFGAIRANFINNWVTPFVETKVGSSTVDVKGLFIAPSVGCRFGVKNNSAFVISVGYEYQKIHDGQTHLYGLTSKIGLEF